MEFGDLSNLIKRKKQTIFTIVFVFFMLTLVGSLAQTIKYTVKSRLLVVQNTFNTDAYVLSKSNEYLGALFAEIVYSSSFYDQVLNSQYNVNKNYFSGTYSQQIKKWRNVVETKTQGNTGIIEINVYHPQSSEAKKIALAVNDILINKNQAYQGGQGVRLNIIDQPIASNYPNKPNLINNLLIALLASLLFALFYIYVFPEEKYSLHILNTRRRSREYHRAPKAEQAREVKIAYTPINYNLKEKDEMQNFSETNNHYQELNGNIDNIIKR